MYEWIEPILWTIVFAGALFYVVRLARKALPKNVTSKNGAETGINAMLELIERYDQRKAEFYKLTSGMSTQERNALWCESKEEGERITAALKQNGKEAIRLQLVRVLDLEAVIEDIYGTRD